LEAPHGHFTVVGVIDPNPPGSAGNVDELGNIDPNPPGSVPAVGLEAFSPENKPGSMFDSAALDAALDAPHAAVVLDGASTCESCVDKPGFAELSWSESHGWVGAGWLELAPGIDEF
jgi:hypothetical protein